MEGEVVQEPVFAGCFWLDGLGKLDKAVIPEFLEHSPFKKFRSNPILETLLHMNC